MTTQTDSTPPGTQGRYGLCSWHKGFSDDVRLIRIEDSGSGPNAPALYACGPCRERHRLVPLADQP
ncbi:hypothetical protein ACQEV4_40535 [Streptomyces shenzhenensis]|uniref:hypothetical protein n=1 Tax=Streptomyces shenzhenensis TaxID=943815 RepID=UPI003D93D4D6